MALEAVDLSAHQFTSMCERDCGRRATIVAIGCMDKQPVLMCDECLDRGIEVIKTYVHLWMRLNKRVLVCGDCDRPVLNLETHLTIKRLT